MQEDNFAASGAVGRVFSFSQIQHCRRFGKNQRLQPFASAAGRAKGLLELFSVELGFGVGFARAVHRRVGQAEHHSPDHAQHQSRIGSPNPA